MPPTIRSRRPPASSSRASSDERAGDQPSSCSARRGSISGDAHARSSQPGSLDTSRAPKPAACRYRSAQGGDRARAPRWRASNGPVTTGSAAMLKAPSASACSARPVGLGHVVGRGRPGSAAGRIHGSSRPQPAAGDGRSVAGGPRTGSAATSPTPAERSAPAAAGSPASHRPRRCRHAHSRSAFCVEYVDVAMPVTGHDSSTSRSCGPGA